MPNPATHTPGPWKASEYYVNSEDHGWVAKCNVLHSPIENQPQSFHDERAMANARLIAASPALLEACKAAIIAIDQMSPRTPDEAKKQGVAWGLARAATAIATGAL